MPCKSSLYSEDCDVFPQSSSSNLNYTSYSLPTPFLKWGPKARHNSSAKLRLVLLLLGVSHLKQDMQQEVEMEGGIIAFSL